MFNIDSFVSFNLVLYSFAHFIRIQLNLAYGFFAYYVLLCGNKFGLMPIKMDLLAHVFPNEWHR